MTKFIFLGNMEHILEILMILMILRSFKKLLKIQPEQGEKPVENQSDFINSVILRFQLNYFFTLLGVVSNVGDRGNGPSHPIKRFGNTTHPISIFHLN